MIDGTVVNSVLSPGVRVEVGAVVRDSIVMFDSVIRSGAVIDRSILDKEVVVGQGAIVGDGPYDDRPNKQEPTRLNTGITVVGKRAVDPPRRADRAQREGRRGRPHRDFVKKVIRSGESVEMRSGVAKRRHEPTGSPSVAAQVAAPDRDARQAAPAPACAPAAPPGNRLDSAGHAIRRPRRASTPLRRPTSSAGSPTSASSRSTEPSAMGSPAGISCSTVAVASISA